MIKFQSDLKTIYPLVKLSNVMAITPPYTFGEQPVHCSRACKFYAATVLTTLLCGYFCNVYGKLNNEILKNFNFILNFIDFVATAFLTLTSVTAMVVIMFWRPEQFKKLLFEIEKFDSSVRLNCANNKFWIGFITFQAITLSTIFMDSFVWTKTFGLKLYVYYIPRNIMWYQFNVAIFLIFWLALEIKRRFKEVNCLLIRCAKGINSSFLIPTLLYDYSIAKIKKKPFYIKVPDTLLLRNIKFWYNDFVKLVQEFNSIFGLILLFTILFNIASIVNYTEVYLLHVVYKTSRTDFESGFIALSLMWIAVAFVSRK